MPQNTYQSLTITSNVTLSWPFSFLNLPVLLDINDINSSSTDTWSITLPDATLVNNGMSVIFNNLSSDYNYPIKAFDNTTIITTINAGISITLYLKDNSTSNGVWGINTVNGGTNGITDMTASSSDSSITITGGTLTPPGGTIDFQLPTGINNLNSINSQGFLVVDSISPPNTYTTTQLAGGANIVITNPTGLNSASQISLDSSVDGLTFLTVGTINFNGREISTTDNGNISLEGGIISDPPLTSGVFINQVIIDPNSNISGVNDLVVSGNLEVSGNISGNIINNPQLPRAFGIIQDGGSGATFSNSYNVAKCSGSAGSYTVTFTSSLPNGSYPVIWGSNIGSGGSIYSPYTTSTSATTLEFKVYVTGTLTAPGSGVSFVIFSQS